MAVPKFDQLFDAVLNALKDLGGSASIAELEDTVSQILNLSEKDLSQVHKGNRTKFSYNLAWARTYLKSAGFIENSEKGVWSLTNKGEETNSVDATLIKRLVRSNTGEITEDDPSNSSEIIQITWEDELLEEIKSLTPKAFERLAQRILRESGFIQVEVTGRSSDGGIDGKGVVRLNLLSFHVHFQCKRYKDVVSPDKVRDFRGAMVGRSDKGLLITTGRFSSEAKREASRDGAPPLELIDGQQLVQMLKNLKLGVQVRLVESIEVDKKWFEDFNAANSK